MSARITVGVSTVASPPAAVATPSGRFFVIGAVASGKAEGVQKITGLAQFRELYGERATANADLYDVLRVFFAEGGAEAYVIGTSAATPDYAALLSQFSANLGPGAVGVAGKAHTVVGEALTEHAAATSRIALLSSAATTVDAVTTDVAIAAAYTSASTGVLVWPKVVLPTVAGTIEIDPIGFAAAKRAKAHAQLGPWQSPIRDIYGTASTVTAVAVETTDAEWSALNTAKVSVIRTVAGKVRLYGWKCLAAPGGVDTLIGGQFRDLTDTIAYECSGLAESFVGRIVDGRGVTLSDFSGQIKGILDRYSKAGALFAKIDDEGNEIDPGYVVDAGTAINSPSSLASGLLKADVGVRLSPTAEFVTISIVAGDAAAVL